MEADTRLEFQTTYFPLSAVSCVFFVVIFVFISPWLSRIITPKYKLLPKYVQAEWHDRAISNVHSVSVSCLSIYAVFFDEELKKGDLWYDSHISRSACAIVNGYMLADCILMLLFCEMKRSELYGFVFHHAATVFAYYYIMTYGVMCYLGMLRLVAEFSTPPVNQRWYLDVLGYPKNSIIVVTNGLSMLFAFFLARIVIMPWFWYNIWIVTGTEAALRMGYLQIVLYLPSFVLDSLNIFWFYKMCRGAYKVLSSLGRDSKRTKA